MDDIDRCSVRGCEFGGLEDHNGNPMCLVCGRVIKRETVEDPFEDEHEQTNDTTLADTMAAAQSGDRAAAERLAGVMGAGLETVATLRLPVSAVRLYGFTRLLAREYGQGLTMRQVGGALVFERAKDSERTAGE